MTLLRFFFTKKAIIVYSDISDPLHFFWRFWPDSFRGDWDWFVKVGVKTAMANPRPLKLFNVALLRSLKNAILEQNQLDL
jgi:hypothetical protein